MKRIIKKIFLFIIIALSLIFVYPSNAFAKTEQTPYVSINNNNSSEIINSSSLTPSKNYQYSTYDYVIDKYDINIIVNENNTLDITETITTYFNVPKHGIFRTIPLKNTITRLDGTTSTNCTQVTNISVDKEYKTLRKNGNYKLQIESPSNTLTGEQTYVIKYTYNLGKDHVKDYDELYYNIIVNEWDTVIGNVTFTITMPKEFDSSKLGFSAGKEGSTDNSKVKYNVSENKITGSYNDILKAGEALTIRCELLEGYFVGAGLSINIIDYIMFLIPIAFLGIAILLWHKFGRDNQVIETVEFYPPEGFNSLEVGFLYKGKAERKDVVSLLIYLANQGYIKIAETEEKTLFSKSKGFKITKLKEYDGNNINEQILLDELFSKNTSYQNTSISSLFNKNDEQETTDNINEVTSIDLYNKFHKAMEKILLNINSEENKNKLFEKKLLGKNIFIILMIIATYCLITIPTVLTYGVADLLIVALLYPGIGFTIILITIYISSRVTDPSISTKLLVLACGGIFGGIPWSVTVLPALLQDLTYLIGYIIGIVCIIGMIICLKSLKKRTPYGNEILGKLKGFKNFLETTEKEKLEAMVMQDPTYFYNILPYAYVLGVSNKWIKKFESISLQVPSWYDSPNYFDMVTFETFMNHTMPTTHKTKQSFIRYAKIVSFAEVSKGIGYTIGGVILSGISYMFVFRGADYITKIIGIPFLICGLSVLIYGILIIIAGVNTKKHTADYINGKLDTKKVKKIESNIKKGGNFVHYIYTFGFAIFWFGLLIVSDITYIKSWSDGGDFMFFVSLFLWIIGICVIKMNI